MDCVCIHYVYSQTGHKQIPLGAVVPAKNTALYM